MYVCVCVFLYVAKYIYAACDFIIVVVVVVSSACLIRIYVGAGQLNLAHQHWVGRVLSGPSGPGSTFSRFPPLINDRQLIF